VLVHQREANAKADKVLALRKVPQVLGAGWGGAGTVEARLSRLASSEDAGLGVMRLEPEITRAYRKIRSADSALSVSGEPRSRSPDSGDSLDYLDIPAFLRTQPELPDIGADGVTPAVVANEELIRVVSGLNARFPDHRAARRGLPSLADLVSLGFAADTAQRFTALVDRGCSEEDVVLAVLSAIAASPEGKRLTRNALRVIRRALRDATPAASLLDVVNRYVGVADRKGALSRWFGSGPG
jgi:hypothetical protein